MIKWIVRVGYWLLLAAIALVSCYYFLLNTKENWFALVGVVLPIIEAGREYYNSWHVEIKFTANLIDMCAAEKKRRVREEKARREKAEKKENSPFIGGSIIDEFINIPDPVTPTSPVSTLEIVNMGCPVTIMELWMIQGAQESRLDVDFIPRKLDIGDTFKFAFYQRCALPISLPELPFPINTAFLKSDGAKLYLIDDRGVKHYAEKRRWVAGSNQHEIITEVKKE